jgi:hypothetical protein
MKKQLFAMLLLLFLAINVMAQSRRVSIGITVGPSIDWLTPKNDQYNGGGIIAGLRYGIPVNINLTEDENYYFSTGILFQHTGGKLEYKGTLTAYPNEEASFTRKYNSIFLVIPTAITLKTPSFGNFVIVGNFGLLHGFALSSKKYDKVKVGDVEQNDQKKTKFENNSFFKEALYVGLGTEYIIQDNFRASFMINYSYSFTNYYNKKAMNYFDEKERMKGNLGAVEFVFGIFF